MRTGVEVSGRVERVRRAVERAWLGEKPDQPDSAGRRYDAGPAARLQHRGRGRGRQEVARIVARIRADLSEAM